MLDAGGLGVKKALFSDDPFSTDRQFEQLDVERVGSAVWVGLGGGHGGSY